MCANGNSVLVFYFKFDLLVPAYKKVVGFCILTLCSAVLLYSLNNSRSFLFLLLDFLHRQSCHLRTEFYVILPNSCTFYFLFLLMVLATILKNSGEREHPCFVHDLSGRASCLSPLSMMLNVVGGFVDSLLSSENFPLFLV